MAGYKLSYFNIRGLAEPIRMMLTDNEIAFTDFQFDRAAWANIKPTMQFGQVPCFHEGDWQIVQTGAIMRHLARKHNLYGSNEKEMTFADMVFEGTWDIRKKYARMIYEEYEESKDDFVQKYLPTELTKWEQLLQGANMGNGFLLGEKMCFADYALFEVLDILQILSATCLDNFPTLKAYHSRMNARPNLQAHLNSEDRKNMKVNGNGKQ